MKVLGIDPGVTATGYGVIENEACIDVGTIRPKAKQGHDRLITICEQIKKLVTECTPDYVALEKVFYHKNIQSLIQSSELRGAIIITLLNCGVNVVEYTPTQIKLTTTGNGRASKQQVRYMIEKIMLGQQHKRVSHHATDALSIAYTGARKVSRHL
ncbi:crossover junction endodeoxyribonuclease RuvC [candidate division WOR-3 bacterium]|nr:crossover junction endodeoxyribonuclease RuvC [candidate division WOR-3 bacterium]